MEGFIQEKANGLAIFQKTSVDVQELKGQVCTGLLDAVNGNFLLADVKLREISTKYDPGEVKQIVEKLKGSADLKESVADHIRECNRTLNAREMEDLNTLLLWVIYGEWLFSIAELEAILLAQQGRASLQTLANEIKEKFSAFFELSSETDERDALVSLKYDSIADYFENSSEHNTSDAIVPKSLTKGEIRLVQHFVEKLCDQDVYNKLGLGAFFDQKLSQSDISVAVDCENAHARIALICLRVMTAELSDEGNELGWYAAMYMASHLK